MAVVDVNVGFSTGVTEVCGYGNFDRGADAGGSSGSSVKSGKLLNRE